MSALDVSQLRARLHDLLMALEAFDVGVQDDYTALDLRWAELEQVWGGYAYREFQEGWQGVQVMIRQYLTLAPRYEAFLRDRIEALDHFERGGMFR